VGLDLSSDADLFLFSHLLSPAPPALPNISLYNLNWNNMTHEALCELLSQVNHPETIDILLGLPIDILQGWPGCGQLSQEDLDMLDSLHKRDMSPQELQQAILDTPK
jgi:hypothetical protein